jgi:hypothetical protein
MVRRKEFSELRKLWDGIVDKDLDAYRLPEALAYSVPSLTAAPVRLLLPQEEPSAEIEDDLPAEDLVPWPLQPLRKLAEALNSLAKSPAEPSGGLLRESLRQSLENAHRHRDFELFKAIVRNSLRYANMLLYERRNSKGDISWYSELANCLTEVKSLWVGDPKDSDIRARIVIMKEWIAPSTYIALANLLEINPDKADLAIQKHVKLIHEIFETGNALVALETLRALDFALTKARPSLRQSTDKDSPLLRRLFQAIGAFASRAVHGTQGENGLAVSHEIARLYALGLHCAPFAAVALAHRMSEADLPQEYGAKVRNQFTLLSTLLYKTAVPSTLDRAEQLFKENFGLVAPTADNQTGDWNAALLERGKDFRDILEWITKTTGQLLRNPEDVQLSELEKLWDQLNTRHPKANIDAGKEDDPYRHSANFWRLALKGLICRISSDNLRTETIRSDSNVASLIPRSIRPSLVLHSTAVVEWCKSQIVRLDQMKDSYKIFDPQRRMYKEALQDLATAAEGLRKGAALQRNVVLGVLGHGLLENLDYHFLALWEIAQALDPIRTWQWSLDSGNSRERPTSGVFADAVLTAIREAEGVPRTLRNIQTLIIQRPSKREKQRISLLFQECSKEVFEWVRGAEPDNERDLWITQPVAGALHFALRELAKNANGHPGRMPVQFRAFSADWPHFLLRFYPQPDIDKEHLKRIQDIALEWPVGPDPKNPGKSHGLGLYLSKLALAAVGWELNMSYNETRNELDFSFTQREEARDET